MDNHSNDAVAIVLLFLLAILSFVCAFVGGFFLHQLLYGRGAEIFVPPQQTGGVEQRSTTYLPGKHFYDEGFYVLTKDDPSVGIVLSVSRSENQDSTYQQSTRMSFFSGDNNLRLVDDRTSSNSAIVSDKIIQNWQTNIDESRVLRENSEISLLINNSNYKLMTGDLTNEIAIRSLPGYTKFFSNGNGNLTFNGQSHPAHVLYYRLYSQNAQDIEFYTQPIGLTTDLVVFWDQKNNLYLIDKSEVAHPINTYKTHQIGFFEDSNQTVSRTFFVNSIRDSVTLPNHYSIILNNPLEATLDLTRLKSINKSPGDAYYWYISTVVGSAHKNGETIPGKGIVEYIKDLK